MSKQGFIVILCGSTGTGKTTAVKALVRKCEKLKKEIHDVRGEYKEFYNKPFEDEEDFIKRVKSVTNTCIVFEEAGMFFEHSLTKATKKGMREIIQCARDRGNVVIFNFHSFRRVPLWILENVKYIIVKKTLFENSKRFEDYPKIQQAIENAKASTDNFYTEVVNMREEMNN